MYSYEWDAETGGYKLNNTPLSFSKEPRPVYYKARELLTNPANGFTVRIGNRLYAHKAKLDKWLMNQML